MPNFLVSYDLNGPVPTHREMDEHLAPVSPTFGRLLETVWYAAYPGEAAQLRDYVELIFPHNDRPGPQGDRVIVAAVSAVAWRNLLVSGRAFHDALEANQF